MEGLSGIPIIDVGCLFGASEADPAAKMRLASQIHDALHNVGFMYLRNTSSPSAEVSSTPT